MFPRPRRFCSAAVALLAAAAIHACGSETKGPVLWERGDDGGGDATIANRSDAAANGCGFDGGGGNVIVLGGQATFSQQHGSLTTGTQYFDPCPPNQAVIGYHGFLTSPDSGLIGDFGLPAIVIGGIETVCGVLGVGGSASNEIVAAFPTPLPMRGTARDSPWTQLCPPNEVVIGFLGRSGLALDRVAFECGHWTIPTTCDSPSIDRIPTILSPAGGNGGGAFQDGCPAGQMAMGSVVRAGMWVDSFGLICGTPSLGSDGG